MSRGAMAFLAGMGTGYLNGEKEKAKQKRQDKLDGQQDELHTAKMDELNLAKSDRAAYKDVMTDTSVQAEQGPPTAEMVAATPAGQEPAPIGYLAGNGTSAKRFAEQGVAQDYANKYNAPESQQLRASKLAAQGNAFANTQLTQNIQREAATGQLKEQKELQGHREFARNVVGAFQDGWSGFAQFATDKYGDGKTYAAIEDGKGGAVIVSTDKDGKEKRTPFASPEEAIAFSVSRADPMKWVDYKTHAADKKSDQANLDRNFTLSERKTQVAERQAAIADKKMDYLISGAAARARAGVGGGGAASGVPGVALKDRRDYLSDFSNGLEDPKTALDPAQAASMQQRNQAKLVQADAIFSTNAEFGVVLTAPQAHAAMSLAQDPSNVRKIRDNNTGQVYETVQVNGKSVILGVGSVRQPAPGGNGASSAASAPDEGFTKFTSKKLAEIAKKPRGVSSYEASQAQQEIDRRATGPQTLKAF